MYYDLSCRYDSRQSFYGKARVLINKNEKDLYSYGTLVAKVLDSKKQTKYIYNGKYSQTTSRHQREFFRQEGLTETEIKKLFNNGVLIVNKEVE